jgi:plasmid stabilization system protein ParE
MLKWTPKAEADLMQIQDHVARHFNHDQALRIVLELVDFCEKTLDKNPLAGQIVTANPLFSVLHFEGNSIYYCENPQDKNLYVVYVRARFTQLDKKRIKSESTS